MPPRLALPAPPPPTLQPAQRACYEALSLALQEGHVFASVTGPEGAGKTTVLNLVLTECQNHLLRCIRISNPDLIPAGLAAQIEAVAYAEASKPENLERHVVLAVDDAHAASDELLQCLARLASMREPGRRVPQVLLVGRPELWQRLATEAFAPLARRVAIRAVLPPLDAETDPWASLEREVSTAMRAGAGTGVAMWDEAGTQAPADDEHGTRLPTQAARSENFYDPEYAPRDLLEPEHGGLPLGDELVAPPMDYALFPDPPAHGEEDEDRPARRSRLLPISCLVLTLAAFGSVLAFYDWPGVLDDLPWTDKVPAKATPLQFSPSQASMGVPRSFGFGHDAAQSGPKREPSVVPTAPAATVAGPVVANLPAPVTARATTPPVTAPSTAPVSSGPAPSRPPETSASNGPVSNGPVSNGPVSNGLVASGLVANAPVGAVAPPQELPPTKNAGGEPASPPAPPRSVVADISPARPSPPPRATGLDLPSVVPPAVVANTTPAAEPPPVPSAAAPALPSAAKPAVFAALPKAPVVVHPAPLPIGMLTLLMRRGEDAAGMGDLSAARLLFERAAEAGSGEAALKLARTYDPMFLSGGAGVVADVGQAKRYYALAADLGVKEASLRLKALNAGR